MKKIALLLSLSILVIVSSCTNEKKAKLLIAGSGSNCVAIMDKETKSIEWSYPIPEKGECNTAMFTSDGNVLFSYSKGARLIDTLGNTIWDFPEEEEIQEIQTARETEDGYFLAVCGTPAKFIFLDKQGNKKSETTFDTGIEASHAQFRQANLSKNGNILIPIMGNGSLLEIDREGNIVNKFQLKSGLFCVKEMEDSNLLVAGEPGVAIYDRKSGELVKQIITDTLPGIKFGFPTEPLLLSNGHMILSNWQGHESVADQALLVEIDASGNEVWVYDDNSKVRFISSVSYFEK